MSLDFDSILRISNLGDRTDCCCWMFCACEGRDGRGRPNSHCVFSGPLPRQLGVLLLKRRGRKLKCWRQHTFCTLLLFAVLVMIRMRPWITFNLNLFMTRKRQIYQVNAISLWQESTITARAPIEQWGIWQERWTPRKYKMTKLVWELRLDGFQSVSLCSLATQIQPNIHLPRRQYWADRGTHQIKVNTT